MSADPSQSPPPSGEHARPLGEISQGPGAFELFLDRNQGTIAILAVVLAIAAAGLVVYRGISEGRERSAGAALSTADDLESLQGVLRNHPTTTAAGSASVLLADRQWDEGDRDAAIQTLRDFIADRSNHAAAPSARASLASKLAAMGNRDETRTQFQAIIDDPAGRFLAPYALISLGDIERAAGDTTAARALYERASTDYPGSSFAETANRRLSLLDAEAPVEIDPPPAPPEDVPPAEFSPTGPGMLPPPSPFSFGTDPSQAVPDPADSAPAPGFFDSIPDAPALPEEMQPQPETPAPAEEPATTEEPAPEAESGDDEPEAPESDAAEPAEAEEAPAQP